MGFMNSYKRLDNLCRDMNGIGVTGYIKDMEKPAKRPVGCVTAILLILAALALFFLLSAAPQSYSLW